jgi:predicted acylesterase/phospholipase RssA
MAGKDNKARDLKKDRRDLVDRLADNEVDWPTHPIGLAFSGGGIRSATLSLGITQALARRGRLYAFDYLSTVS